MKKLLLFFLCSLASISLNAMNLDEEDQETPIHESLRGGLVSSRAFTRLIQRHIKFLNTRSEDGDTPLHLAVKNDDDVAIELLANAGADLEELDAKYRSPLEYAAEIGSFKSARKLIEKKAKINPDEAGWPAPLHKAAECGQLEIAQLLLDKGADVNAIDGGFHIPLHEVSSNTVKKIKRHDSNVNGDISPVHIREQKKEAIAQLLLERGSWRDWYNTDGRTPEDEARFRNKNKLANMLACGTRCSARIAKKRKRL